MLLGEESGGVASPLASTVPTLVCKGAAMEVEVVVSFMLSRRQGGEDR